MMFQTAMFRANTIVVHLQSILSLVLAGPLLNSGMPCLLTLRESTLLAALGEPFLCF